MAKAYVVQDNGGHLQWIELAVGAEPDVDGRVLNVDILIEGLKQLVRKYQKEQ